MSAAGAVRLFCTSASASARISNSSMWAIISFLRSVDCQIVSCDVFEIGAEIPNAETGEAIEEVRKMKANPMSGKTYTDVDVMMEDLLA